ncbi:hypothetical protein JW872_01070 [Candidatus Babeliales bacterium]|nr:hypothetical protein [Candidatus Babeliales bacterium]
MSISESKIVDFRNFINNFYVKNRRAFSWRDDISPYRVFVSEIMLQQTQTSRVEQKFEPFIKAFPSFQRLTTASLSEILRYWQGLGYNRRSLALHKGARIIMDRYAGILPSDPGLLVALPGIGPATAASMVTFAYNKATVFIETNIRSVLLHHFFPNKSNVTDKQLLPIVEQVLDKERPRDWYYALMDYGVMLKKQYVNPSRASAHYVTQKSFKGSNREIRGMILRYLTQQGFCSQRDLEKEIPSTWDCVQKNLHAFE